MRAAGKLFIHRFHAFKYAFEGLKNGIQKETPLMIHFVALLLVISAGIYFRVSKLDWIILISCSGLVITIELINTALESLCNFISKERLAEIKYIKDLGAAAVLISVIVALCCGAIIFGLV